MSNANTENAIEFITNQHTATVSFTSRKYVNKIKKLYESHPEDFKYCHENDDGSICANIPLKWIKISPPRQISEEQKEAAAERFKKMRQSQ